MATEPEVTSPPEDDRFSVLGQLGSGSMGLVYRVLDRTRGREMALKTMTATSARDLYRFKREFRSLCDLAHPNLCALDELHTTGDEWFLTMELIHGVSFRDWVRPGGVVDHDRLTAALGQLCDGVLALHVAGKLHRDLKPSNVLVEAGGRVVLLDFGLVAELEHAGPDHTHSRAAVGTPAYMSPEQAADLPLAPASDWYSVGIMLYEALTGRRPFEGMVRDVLERKQRERARPPREVVPATPAALDELCVRLLAIDPAARPDGRAILAALGRAPSPATETIERTAAAGPFVGRAELLAALEEAQVDARHGGVAVVVHGASGMGKSALIGRFLARRPPGVLALAGRCYQRDNVPYKTLDMLIDALTDALIALPPAERARVLPPDVVALARLFPVVRRVPEVSEPRVIRWLPADPQELRARAWTALRAILAGLAALHDVVVVVDDLQWGDLDSVGFLADLIARPDRPPILVIVAHRDDDDSGPIVGALERRIAAAATPPDVRRLSVPALAEAEARALIEELIAGDPLDRDGASRSAAGDHVRRRRATDVDAVIRDARGHTMFLAELARAASGDTPPPSLDQLLAARVARLPAEARALLDVCSVAARAIRRDVAARAAGLDDAAPSVAMLRAERLIRTAPGAAASQIEPFHDRVRAAVVDRLSPDALRAVHRALALAYRAAEPSAHDRFIDHLLGAGLEREAAEAAAWAAVAAEHALAFLRAADLYAIALAHGDPAASTRGSLLVARARVLGHAGRPDESADAYGLAIAEAAPADRIELERRRVEATLRAGRLSEGLGLARELLARLGYKLPATGRGGLAKLIAHRMWLAVRGLRSRERPASELPPESLVKADVLSSVASGLSFANPILARVVQAWHLELMLSLGEPGRLGAALSLEIGYLAGRSTVRARIDRVAVRAREVAERSGDRYQLAVVEASLGFAAFMLGEWPAAANQLAASLGPLRDHLVGERWQIDLAEIFLLASLFHAGRLAELVDRTNEFLADAFDRGNVYAQHGIRAWRSNLTWLILDRPDEARRHVAEVEAQRGERDFHVNEWYQLVTHTHIDLYLGDGVAAHARLDAAAPGLARSHLMRLPAIRVETTYLRARAAIARAIAPSLTAHVSPAIDLGIALGHADALSRNPMPWGKAYGALVTAAAHQAGNDRAAALRAYHDAEARFAACAMDVHLHIARLARATLDGDTALADPSIAWMRAQRIADPTRFARVFAPRG